MGGVGPVSQRLHAIDACRGLALLGIFMVNMDFFSRPFGEMITGAPPEGSSSLDTGLAFVIKTIFTGKFVAQFSMLFGAGLILQMLRVESRGKSFVPLYLRRLAFLGVIGLIHGVFIWIGDILMMYTLAGIAMLLLRKCKPRTLLKVAAGIFLFTCLLQTGALALQSMMTRGPQGATEKEPAQTSAPAGESGRDASDGGDGGDGGEAGDEGKESPQAEPDEPGDGKASDDASAAGTAATELPVSEQTLGKTPVERLIAGLSEGKIQDPSSAEWKQIETDVYRNGGFWSAVALRLITWAAVLLPAYLLFGYLLMFMSFFFLGAALLKLDFFSQARTSWHKRLVFAGLAVGLPMSIASAIAMPDKPAFDGPSVAAVLGFSVSAILMAVMYMSGIALLTHSGRCGVLVKWLATTGRMPLTNYLMQSVCATFIFYWWGLGMFGMSSQTMNVAIVLGVYMCQIVISNLWLSRFRFGPTEWLWRTITYMKVQPMLVSSARHDVAGS